MDLNSKGMHEELCRMTREERLVLLLRICLRIGRDLADFECAVTTCRRAAISGGLCNTHDSALRRLRARRAGR